MTNNCTTDHNLKLDLVRNAFFVLTINHRTAPVQIRERFSLDVTGVHRVLTKLREFFYEKEALIISTCNRTEVYYTSCRVTEEDIVKLLSSEKGVLSSELEDSYQYISNADLAVNHLFKVSLGLESKILGDMQIIGQVKDAYQISCDLGMAGAFLHRLMHTIFYANKRMVNETDFHQGVASVSYAAFELSRQILSKTRPDAKVCLSPL